MGQPVDVNRWYQAAGVSAGHKPHISPSAPQRGPNAAHSPASHGQLRPRPVAGAVAPLPPQPPPLRITVDLARSAACGSGAVPEAAAARYWFGGGVLRLLIEADQRPGCPECDGQTRVSSPRTGVVSGPR